MKRIVLFAVTLVTGILTMLPLGAKAEDDYIKYAEFNVTYQALCEALETDIESYGSKSHMSWIDLLSFLGARYGGDFTKYKTTHLREYEKRLKEGDTPEEIGKDLKFYGYYKQVYTAVLGGFLGEYETHEQDEKGKDKDSVMYGLTVYSPIAAGFAYSHYDDFGADRSYGYKRQHLGHDMMAAVGTPVVAIEDGYVEVMGWNEYGGWRVGIRSHDKMRYYYYAHLRQNRPFHADLREGEEVKAGQVIGYVGRTGYSKEENTNGIETNHLHLGLELIFDESQKESVNEIWVDLYAITKLLDSHKSKVTRVALTKEFYGENQVVPESE